MTLLFLAIACAPGTDPSTTASDNGVTGSDPTTGIENNTDDGTDTADTTTDSGNPGDTNSEDGEDTDGTTDGCTTVPGDGYAEVLPAQDYTAQTEFDVTGSAVYGCTDRWYLGIDFGPVADYTGVIDFVEACKSADCNGTSEIDDWTTAFVYETSDLRYMVFFPVNSQDELTDECGDSGEECFGRLHMMETTE